MNKGPYTPWDSAEGDSRSSLMAAALLEYVSQRPERELA